MSVIQYKFIYKKKKEFDGEFGLYAMFANPGLELNTDFNKWISIIDLHVNI